MEVQESIESIEEIIKAIEEARKTDKSIYLVNLCIDLSCSRFDLIAYQLSLKDKKTWEYESTSEIDVKKKASERMKRNYQDHKV